VHSDLDFLLRIDQSYFMVLIEGFRDGRDFSIVLNKRSTEKKPGESSLITAAAVPLWHRGADLA